MSVLLFEPLKTAEAFAEASALAAGAAILKVTLEGSPKVGRVLQPGGFLLRMRPDAAAQLTGLSGAA